METEFHPLCKNKSWFDKLKTRFSCSLQFCHIKKKSKFLLVSVLNRKHVRVCSLNLSPFSTSPKTQNTLTWNWTWLTKDIKLGKKRRYTCSVRCKIVIIDVITSQSRSQLWHVVTFLKMHMNYGVTHTKASDNFKSAKQNYIILCFKPEWHFQSPVRKAPTQIDTTCSNTIKMFVYNFLLYNIILLYIFNNLDVSICF